MKNLKKVLALVLSLAMIVSTFTVSFAAETKTDAEVCEDLGLIKGDGDGVTDEYLASESPRWKIAIMTLRLQGLYEDALAFEGTETFEDATDMTWEAGRAVLAYLKANPELGWIGNDNKIDPNGKMTVQQYYKVMLETLGYKQGTDFEWAEVMDFAAEKGLVVAADAEELTMADVAAVTVEVLAVENSEGVVLVDALVEAGAIDEAVAADLGLVEVAPSEVAIKSAVALNSKVIKVTLSEAAEEVSVAQFTITDKDAAAVEVASVELAPWDTDNKTVLVTLAADSTSGNLYTVTSGATSVNFGGKAKDETKPAIDTVTSSDYNEVTITFKEAVRIDGLTVKLAKKYGDTAELATLDMSYSDEKTILVKTEDQAASTLYGLVVEGAVDLAGNTMDKDDAKSFVGTKKEDAKQKVSSASALDYNKVYVEFGTNVDFDTLSDATFKLEKAYGTATEIAVLEAKQATDVEAGEFNTALSSTADKKKAAKKGIVLMVEDMTASTLYKLTVEGVGTLYSQPMSTTTADKTTTFVGQAKPTGKFKVAGDVKTVSATTIDVTFERKVDKDLAEDIANYEIKKAYGDTAELAVLAAEVQSNGKTVRITVGEMKNSTLYKMVITNLKDIYGNDQDKMEPTFVGQGKQDKISSVVGIERINDTTIRVEFNKNVGENAADVSLYFINNGVGYPESVATVSGTVTNAPAKVDLTIPETTDGKTYELAVKGLNNADGIAMDADGVKGTFVGRGLAATLPQITGAVALSNSKIEVYFDRDVTDSSIKGRFWDGSVVNRAILNIRPNYDYSTIISPGTDLKAYQNPQNKNSLVIVGGAGAFAPVTTGSNTYDKLILTGVKTNIKGNTSSTDRTLTVATNGTTSYGPQMIGIVAVDKKHLEIHFDQPVDLNSATTISGLAIWDDARSSIPISLSGHTASVDPSNKTKLDVYTTNSIAEATSSSDKDNQFVLELGTLASVKGLDGEPAKSDKNGDTVLGYQLMAFAGSSVDQAAGVDSGIFGVFTDQRTLEVMFPQPMKSGTITPVANMGVQKYNGTATSGSVINPKYVTYSGTNNKATLHFDTPIVLGTGETEMKLVVTTNVQTAGSVPVCANKSVTPKTDYLNRVAPQDTDSAKPALASVNVDDSRKVLTVTFDKEVSFGAYTDFASTTNNAVNLVGTNALVLTTQAPAVLSSLKLTATRGDDVAINELMSTSAEIGTVVVKRLPGNKAVELTLQYSLKAGTEVKVTMDTTASKVLSWTKVGNETDASKVSSVTTGVSTQPLYDGVPPTLISATATDGNYKVGDKISITLNYDENVTVTGTPLITLSDGIGNVNYVSGSGTAKLVFDYTVVAGQSSLDLIVASLTGTITAANNSNHSASTLTNMDLGSVVVDGDVPVLASVTVNDGTGDPALKNKVVTIDFNEAVINNTADVAALKAQVVYAADGTTFNALASGDSVAIVSGDLVVTFAAVITDNCKIKINANALKDAASNTNAEITTAAITLIP